MFYVGPQGDEDDLVLVLDTKPDLNPHILPNAVHRNTMTPTVVDKVHTVPDASETHEQLVVFSF